MNKNKKLMSYIILTLLSIFIVGCSSPTSETIEIAEETEQFEQETITKDPQENEDDSENGDYSENELFDNITNAITGVYETIQEELLAESTQENNVNNIPTSTTDLGKPDTTNHRLIEVDGGDTNGHREANVVVNVGFGDRDYWAYTNEHGQLVRVTAAEIIPQDTSTEEVNSNGRYYSRMANVPGVGAEYGYDRGHVIADSLGGVANAYNITPQEAVLNRHGDQAYMERVMRDAGGVTDLEAIITYPDTNTQIPSHYEFTYTIKGNRVKDSFANTNPERVNAELGLTEEKENKESSNANSASSSDINAQNPGNVEIGDVESVDTNGNGIVTIQEAKDAGFSMPIYKGHWLYEYMIDRNGNGMVGG